MLRQLQETEIRLTQKYGEKQAVAIIKEAAKLAAVCLSSVFDILDRMETALDMSRTGEWLRLTRELPQ